MFGRVPLLLAGFTTCFLVAIGARAQGPCSSTGVNNKVACTIPQLYGPNGLAFNTLQGPPEPLFTGVSFGPASVFTSFNQGLSPLSSAIATQLSFLPLVTPAAGLTLTFDRSLGVYTVSDDSFTPVFSERGGTIGRNRFAVGFSYQNVSFGSLDGVDLRNFPAVYLRGDQTVSGTGTCSITGPSPSSANTGVCALVRDYITAQSSINLTVNQYTTFVTYGLTNHIDVSAAIPVLTVRMSMTSNATIVQQSLSSATLFLDAPVSAPFTTCTPSVSSPLPFDSGVCTKNAFSRANSASGVGDVTFRGKGTVMKGERAALAVGVDFRVPTGDASNFLGSGAYGIKPFAVWSYSGRISPHFNAGYGWNGNSILAGDVTAGTKSQLPSEVFYSAGVEAGIIRRLTATLDVIGQRVFSADRVQLSTISVPGVCDTYPGYDQAGPPGCQHPAASGNASSLTQGVGSYGITNASLGLRLRPFGKFLLTGNVLLPLDDGGLRAKVIPTVSGTYTFR